MLTALLAVGILTSPQQTPGALISKMLAYYNSAQSVTGTVKLTAVAGRDKATVDTTLQFEKPGKLYLLQVKKSPAETRQYLVTSNGTQFSYDPPNPAGKAARLLENVKRGNASAQVRDIYFITSKSIVDKSPVLDCVFSNPLDLQVLRNQWASMTITGTEEIRGKTATIIQGKLKEGPDSKPVDDFLMAITAEGDLLKYAVQQTIHMGQDSGMAGQSVTYTVTWDADLKVNAPVNQDLFKVKR